MAFNKYQIEAIKKIQNILKLEYLSPESFQKQLISFQNTLKNLSNSYAKNFNIISSKSQADHFVLDYLNSTLSKESFEKIKTNYKKTKKIFLQNSITNKNKDQHLPLNPFENMVNAMANTPSDLNIWSKMTNIKKLPKDKQSAAKSNLEKELSSAVLKNPNVLDDILNSIGLNMDELNELGSAIMNNDKEKLDIFENKLNKALDDMSAKDPDLYIKLAKTFDIDLPKIDIVKSSSYITVVDKINETEIEVKDPKKSMLFFVDEQGKIHKLGNKPLTKGKYKFDPEKGFIKQKQKER